MTGQRVEDGLRRQIVLLEPDTRPPVKCGNPAGLRFSQKR